jgi:GT2 family glycosyltransferase
MIDTDVILTEGWYEQLIRHFGDPKTAAVIGTCVYGFGCKPLEAYWDFLRKNDTVNFGCHNTMFRRDILLRIGNFDRTIRGAGEDYDLYLRILSAGYRWVWDKEAIVNHPMGLFEYLSHVRWWARASPRIKNILKAESSRSLFRIYASQAFLVLEGFKQSIKLAVRVHPIMLLYYPLIKLNFFFITLQETRKMNQSRE